MPAVFLLDTVMPEQHADFIKVVIDENLTGYAGSRIRLRLLDGGQPVCDKHSRQNV
jgi:hypothetical protein